MNDIKQRQVSLDSPNTTHTRIPPYIEEIEAVSIVRAEMDGNGMVAKPPSSHDPSVRSCVTR